MAASQGEHARVPAGTLVNNRYVVVKEVGCGNFSKVYQCRDTKSPRGSAASADSDGAIFALKILKREYANDANFERDMLKVLAQKDPTNTANVSKMHDQFVWNKYPCFVMPLRGPSLRSRKFGISRGHVSRSEVVRLAKSLISSLKFVHFDCKMVHTDLKPENILLNDDVPHLGNEWTICDFGSASLWRLDRMDSDLISTRPYRAPEVVLGNPWSFPADMWSAGCILYEAACGSRLFEVHDDNTHLHFMTARLGPLPEQFSKKSKHSKKFFDVNGNFLRPLSSPAAGRAAAAAAAASSNTSLPRSMAEALKDDPQLLDLLQSMLRYDPSDRVRADVALQHPIFNAAEVTPRVGTQEKEVSSQSRGVSAGAASSSEKSSQQAQRLPKFRALPPLMNALTAIGIDSSSCPGGGCAKENLVSSAPSAVIAAQRPLHGVCRTPEELKRAPLSAHAAGASRITAADRAACAKLPQKFGFAGIPAAGGPTTVSSAKPFPSAAAAAVAAGKASGLQYFHR